MWLWTQVYRSGLGHHLFKASVCMLELIRDHLLCNVNNVQFVDHLAPKTSIYFHWLALMWIIIVQFLLFVLLQNYFLRNVFFIYYHRMFNELVYNLHFCLVSDQTFLQQRLCQNSQMMSFQSLSNYKPQSFHLSFKGFWYVQSLLAS